jgi:hypothetical protein
VGVACLPSAHGTHVSVLLLAPQPAVKCVRLNSLAYDSQILKRLSSIADDFSPADVATCLGNESDAEVLGMLALSVPLDSTVHFRRS